MKRKMVIVLSLLLVLVIAIMPVIQTTKATGEFSGIYTGDTTFPNDWPNNWDHSAKFYFSLFNGSFFNSFNNESVISTQNVSLRVQTSIGEIPFNISLLKVTYKASWENESVTIFHNDIDKTHITNHTFGPNVFWSLLNFTNGPRGPNNIEFVVEAGGIFVDRKSTPQTYKFANCTNTENLAFTIDNGIVPTPSNTSPEKMQAIDEQNLALLITTIVLLTSTILTLGLLYKRNTIKKN